MNNRTDYFYDGGECQIVEDCKIHIKAIRDYRRKVDIALSVLKELRHRDSFQNIREVNELLDCTIEALEDETLKEIE